MLPLWRLTRNRFGKRLHATLDAVALVAALVHGYRSHATEADDGTAG